VRCNWIHFSVKDNIWYAWLHIHLKIASDWSNATPLWASLEWITLEWFHLRGHAQLLCVIIKIHAMPSLCMTRYSFRTDTFPPRIQGKKRWKKRKPRGATTQKGKRQWGATKGKGRAAPKKSASMWVYNFNFRRNFKILTKLLFKWMFAYSK